MSVARSSSPTRGRAASRRRALGARTASRRSSSKRDGLAQRRERAAHGLELLALRVVLDEREHRLRVAEDVRALRRGVRRVEPDHDGADRHDRPVEEHPLEAGAGEHGDRIAAPHAVGEQGRARARRPGAPPRPRRPAATRRAAPRGTRGRGEPVLPEAGVPPEGGGPSGASASRRASYAGGKGTTRANRLGPSRLCERHANHLERINQLRPRQHPDRARARDPAAATSRSARSTASAARRSSRSAGARSTSARSSPTSS